MRFHVVPEVTLVSEPLGADVTLDNQVPLGPAVLSLVVDYHFRLNITI